MASGNDTPDPNKPPSPKRSISAAALKKSVNPKPLKPAEKPKKK